MDKQPEIYNEYFRHRNIIETSYSDFKLPAYLKKVLPIDKTAQILDIGCGFGQTLLSLKKEGYISLRGVDISDEAVNYCSNHGIDVMKIMDLRNFCLTTGMQFDFIIMSHVLEHLEKSVIVETLKLIKQHLMKPGASLIIMVPNAQSNTGCYWAYEDFTHHTLFTAGSLYFVLKSVGFESVVVLDPDGLEGSRPVIKQLRKILLSIYKANINFWNIVTNSSFHRQSPQIFTYEIKAVAR